MPTFQFSHGNLKSIQIIKSQLLYVISEIFSSVYNNTEVHNFQSPIRCFPIFNIHAELLTWGNFNSLKLKLI